MDAVVSKENTALLLNCQGINPSAESCQKWKVPFLSEQIIQPSPNSYPIIALTETWLKPFISNAQVKLPTYDVYRSDRIKRDRGGALLYIKSEIPVTIDKTFDDDTCEAIFCVCPSLKLMVFCAYKPCDASLTSFSNLLCFMSDCIRECDNSPGFTTMILGDLNFPDMWSVNSDQGTAVSSDEKAISNFMNDNFLSQYVDVPTRGNNILDVFLTNNDELVYKVNTESTILSDHRVVEILLTAGKLSQQTPIQPPAAALTGTGFHSLNLFEADYPAICDDLSSVDWHSIWGNSNLDEFPSVLYNKVLHTFQKYTPLKPPQSNKKLLYMSYGSFIPKNSKKVEKTKTSLEMH